MKMGLSYTSSVSYLFVFILLSCNAIQNTLGANIVVTSNSGSSQWWLAYAVSDNSTNNVQLMDSGSFTSWTAMEQTNWGYWVLSTNGVPVVFPVSLRITDGTTIITLNDIFTSASPGQSVNTGVSFSNPTQNPNNPPSSSTNGPSAAPPTQAPPTGAPTTTHAPTTGPSQPHTTGSSSPRPPTAGPSQPPTTAPATPTTAGPDTPSTVGSNPFAGTQYYLNPHYALEIDSSIDANPSLTTELSTIKNFASAFWIDRMSVIDNVSTILTQARMQATQSGQQVMVALVVYDLPDRDCAAAASNGEISCADATCAAGINTYKTEFIDPIAETLASFTDLTIVTVIEPDSLPNLATNLAVPKCQQAQIAYTTGVAYAIQKLSALSNVHIYVDAAHGGWLGWAANLNAAVTIFSQVLTQAGGSSKIRGFSTNVANYQPLGSMTSTDDPCNLESQFNFAINEVKYVSLLDAAMVAGGITGMHYIIDTGRNGVPNSRTDCSNWCNIKNSGLGVPPTSNTSSSGVSNIDGYFWVKPPGESDGTSNSSSPRFDFHCASVDSMVPAPEAGEWFSALLVSEAGKANPAL